jgi:hypothetical protein
MAHHAAVAALAQAVLKLLEAHSPRDGHAAPPQFVLHSGTGLARLPVEGFSVGVWRVGVVPTLRQPPARLDAEGQRRSGGLPVELGLLLTPWAADAHRQLGLLGWALRFVEDHRVLPAALLNQALVGAAPPVFGPHEAVEILPENLGLPEHLALRAQLGPRWPAALCCTVRGLNLEPGQPGAPG